MTTLPDHCVPCRGDVPALSEAEATALHAAHAPDWDLVFPRLRRRFELPDFRAALRWVNRVGMLAEEEDHHPDIHVLDYRFVELELTTHAVRGLHANDFVLARKIDQLFRAG